MIGSRPSWCAGLLLSGLAAAAQAQMVAVDDTFSVPYDASLVAEAPGVLANDTFDGDPAEDAGATVVLVDYVFYGTLSCESDPGLDICADGSFTYTPDEFFPGTDSFTYEAAVGAETSQATVTLTACSGGPTVFTCWKEPPYLAKLGELGYRNFQEGFEDDVAWGSVREPTTAPSVVSQGIAWQSNHPAPPASNELTTGTGPARTGTWGLYDPDHGYATGSTGECNINDPPLHCLYKDGFTGTRQSGETTLYGVGGHFTGSSAPNLAMILDGGAPIGLGLVHVADPPFFGVIDTTGFTTFRLEETDGKIGQTRKVFGDDFIFGTTPADTVPPQVALVNSVADTGDGVLGEGEATAAPITQLLVSFDELVSDLGAETPPDSVTNPANYLLFSDGGDGFQTVDCATGVDPGDVAVTVDWVTYLSGSERTATLDINGGVALPAASYRLLVCGTTSIQDWAGNALDGDGNATGGDDFQRNFTVTGAVECIVDADCDDALFCNGAETCVANSCVPGTPVDCNDGVSCTVDSCNEATDSCDNTPNNSLCDNGLFCDGTETCHVTLDCQAGTPVDCSDGVGCTDDSCDEANNVCVNTPNDANCPDDGLFCNGIEFCDAVLDCSSTGDPCPAGETCNETGGICEPGVNRPPVAVDDSYTTDEDVPLNVAAPGVLGNDSDADGDPLTAVLDSGPSNPGGGQMGPVVITQLSNATLTLYPDGSFSYTPSPDFFGTDTFTYVAHDGLLDSNVATVTITVNPIDDAPVAADDTYATDVDWTRNVAAPGVLGNDRHPDGDPITAIEVTAPSSGTLSLSGDGSFAYTPDLGFRGTDAFTYKAHSGLLDSNIATVTIHVGAVADSTPPQVAWLSSVADTGDGRLVSGEPTLVALTELLVTFSEAVQDPPGDGDPDDVTNPASFLLLADGNDDFFQTSICGAVLGDDQRVSVGSVLYDEGSLTAALLVNGAVPLPAESYRLLVCGSAAIRDLVGNKLDGDGDGIGGDDYRLDFEVTVTDSLLNPNFDVDLSGWTLTSPTGTEIDHQKDDADGATTSGSARMLNLSGVDAQFAVSQCIPVLEGQAYEFGGMVRIWSAVSGHPTAAGIVDVFATGDCTEGALSSATTTSVVGDIGGAWNGFDGTLVAPPTSQSALVSFFVDAGKSPDFEVAFDRLYLHGTAPICGDGFESGNTSAWSGTVP